MSEQKIIIETVIKKLEKLKKLNEIPAIINWVSSKNFENKRYVLYLLEGIQKGVIPPSEVIVLLHRLICSIQIAG